MPAISPDIVDEVASGNLPGAPNVGQPPTPGQTGAIRARLDQEYVAGGGWQHFQNYVRSLPAPIDDITRDFGADFYERMMLDAHIAGDLGVIKSSILESGLNLAPAKPDEGDDGHAQSVAICDAATRMLDELDTPIDDVWWDMADATATGNRVAELVYRQDSTLTGKRQLILTAIKVKPQRSTAFVVDAFMNVKGLLGRIPGQGYPVQQGTLLTDPAQVPNLLPREKFAIWTFRPKNGDPRGTSLLRPAYNAWWIKTQLWAQYLKYLIQFGGPSLVGNTAPGAQSDPSQLGLNGKPLTPEQSMLSTVLEFQSGTAAVFPAGALLAPISVPADGQSFLDAFGLCNSEMTKAILAQLLATEEGKHSTRAQATVHKDVLDGLIRQIQQSFVRMVRVDILRRWVGYNYGPRAAAELTPKASFGETEAEDFGTTATAVASLTRYGFLHRSQFPGLDQRMNLPARDPNWQQDDAPPIEQISATRVAAREGEGTTGALPTGGQQGAKAA